MESQYTPLLLQKIIDSQAAPLPGLTRRDYATLQREVRALQDTRQQWPQAHCLLVAQQVPPTVALCRQHYGVARSGVVFGWVFASHMIGAGIGATVAGVLRMGSGSSTTVTLQSRMRSPSFRQNAMNCSLPLDGSNPSGSRREPPLPRTMKDRPASSARRQALTA